MLLGKILTNPNKALWSHPGIDGVKLTFEWRKLEPKLKQYDFSTLEAELWAVPSHKKKVLEILGGVFAPEWLQPRIQIWDELKKGERAFKVTLPVVWNRNYVKAMQDLYFALGAFLGEDGIDGLNATFISSSGPTLRFAPKYFGPPAKTNYFSFLESWGYSTQNMVDAWNEIAKVASYQWPAATLIIPVENSEEESFPTSNVNEPGLLTQILTHSMATYPTRTMVKWGGNLSARSSTALIAERLGTKLAFKPLDGKHQAPENHDVLFVGEVK